MSVMAQLAQAKAAALPKKPVVPGLPATPDVNTAALPKPMINPQAPGTTQVPVPNINPGIVPGGPTPMKPPVPGTIPGAGGPTAMPPVNPPGSMPTQPLTTFGPGNDLRSTQINPGTEPDRLALASNYFSSLAAADEPGFDADIRKITQRAAAGGSTGSGMFRSDLTDAATNRHNNLLQQAAGLAYEGGSAAIGDQANNRAELRTERGYQTDQAKSALDRATEQRLLENYLLDSQFNRNRATANDLSGIAFG